MTTYTLNIYIAPKLVDELKNYGYSLCIAKKVAGNEYKVIWKAKNGYITTDKFQWIDSYQVFGQLPPVGIRVKADTNIVDIAGGQTVDLDKNGVMDQATGIPHGTTFTVVNNYQPIYFGVNCKIDGEFLPIYIDPEPTVTGFEELTPKEFVYVCFERGVETSSIVAQALSSGIEVDFTSTTTNAVSYVVVDPKGNGGWIPGPPPA